MFTEFATNVVVPAHEVVGPAAFGEPEITEDDGGDGEYALPRDLDEQVLQVTDPPLAAHPVSDIIPQ